MKNKGTRGDVNSYYKATDRNLLWFQTCDTNDVLDARLRDQNRQHSIALSSSAVNATDTNLPEENIQAEDD